jgi:hypothetical protein
MSNENKDIARRFLDAFMSGDTAALTDVVAEDVIDHNPRPGQSPGREAVVEAIDEFHVGFGDLASSLECEIAEGELVVHYGVMTGTHTGGFMGLPASGRPIRVPWIDIHRVVDGQIVESWHLEDIAAMTRQLTPEQALAR